MTTTEVKQEKGARNQSLFRSVNERIDQLSAADAVARSERLDFLCECADKGCLETVALTHDEYEAVRRTATHFPITPGHDDPDIERVVERQEGYVVVEKVGAAADVAVALNPRG